MVESHPLKIFYAILNLFRMIEVFPGKYFHCHSNEQVQIGNQTVVSLVNGQVGTYD